MRKFEYTVKGLDSLERGEQVKKILSTVVPNASDVSVDVEGSRLEFSLSKKEISSAEERIAGAFAISGFELVLPEGVESYTFVGEKPKKIRTIPVSVAVALVAFFVAFTLLFGFAACELYPSGQNNRPDAEAPTGNIIIEDEDIPDYIKELIKLDAIFKENSYEGIDESEMGDAILKAYIAATGDVYAEYMTKEEFDAYNSESVGEFVGIGVSIVNTTIEINGYHYKVLQVISVFENSPAIENDVRVGDCIMYVGEGAERVMTDQLGYTEALNRMLGEAGTEAKFTVFRPDKSEDIGYKEINFSIVRRKVTTESVKYRVSETDSRVGIINVTGFDATTAIQFTKAVNALTASGCEFFVFDMRNNPGGALASIEAVLSYFLDEGDVIVSTEYADGTKETDKVSVKNYSYYYGEAYKGYDVLRSDIGKYKHLKGKCVVLTNENTASAAELFTATFRDYGIAPIVGETTYGKGCMQNIIDLKKNYGMEGALRVTTAMYFSASHRVYHGTGIEPDYKVALSPEAQEYNFFLLPEDKDDQLKKAIDVLFNK